MLPYPLPPSRPHSTYDPPDTTRSPRPGEIDGREYNFTTTEAFLQLVEERGFIEYAQFGGNYYGTSIKAVKDLAEKGLICVLDIEMEVHSLCKRIRIGDNKADQTSPTRESSKLRTQI